MRQVVPVVQGTRWWDSETSGTNETRKWDSETSGTSGTRRWNSETSCTMGLLGGGTVRRVIVCCNLANTVVLVLAMETKS